MTTRVRTWDRWHGNVVTHRARRHGRPRNCRKVWKLRTAMVNNETAFVVDRSRLYVSAR